MLPSYWEDKAVLFGFLIDLLLKAETNIMLEKYTPISKEVVVFKSIVKKQLGSLLAGSERPIVITHADGTVQKLGRGQGVIDIRICDSSVYRCLFFHRSVAFGEAFAEGKITVSNLYELFLCIFAARKSKRRLMWESALRRLQRYTDRNDVVVSRNNVEAHYGANHKIIEMITGSTRQYSCAFFPTENTTLDDAQKAKIDRTLDKLKLDSSDSVLDIGCGYGELILTASKLGAWSFGITDSESQASCAEAKIFQASLEGTCRVAVCDYRDVSSSFTKIVSVGMFEHVGPRYWQTFFQKVHSLLDDEGIFLLHTCCYKRPKAMDGYIRKIFPGGFLPTISEVIDNALAAGFELYHLENWHEHYNRTVPCWLENLEKCKQVIVQKFGEAHYRHFLFYLSGSAATFASPNGMRVCQFVFTKKAKWQMPVSVQ